MAQSLRLIDRASWPRVRVLRVARVQGVGGDDLDDGWQAPRVGRPRRLAGGNGGGAVSPVVGGSEVNFWANDSRPGEHTIVMRCSSASLMSLRRASSSTVERSLTPNGYTRRARAVCGTRARPDPTRCLHGTRACHPLHVATAFVQTPVSGHRRRHDG